MSSGLWPLWQAERRGALRSAGCFLDKLCIHQTDEGLKVMRGTPGPNHNPDPDPNPDHSP